MTIQLEDKLLIYPATVQTNHQTNPIDGMNVVASPNEIEMRFGWGITLHTAVQLHQTDGIRFLKLLLEALSPTLTAEEQIKLTALIYKQKEPESHE
ncbi:hypothetical protein ACQ4M3_20670 [Leptolyngbya sp. AN03gr2]|uniref:hypothetical protein n=1 Tax=unclassified Leptolyngbya TaxID=2650499 RepID=UPI003D31DB0D